MSSYKDSIAKAIIDGDASQEVIGCLRTPSLQLTSSAAWALEQLSAHGVETTGPLVQQGALQQLVDVVSSIPDIVECQPELYLQLKSAIKSLVRGCDKADALQSFVAQSTPPQLLKHLLRRLEPLLRDSPKARQAFVTSGALMRMQGVEGGLCDRGRGCLESINALFPEDVVLYYRE